MDEHASLRFQEIDPKMSRMETLCACHFPQVQVAFLTDITLDFSFEPISSVYNFFSFASCTAFLSCVTIPSLFLANTYFSVFATLPLLFSSLCSITTIGHQWTIQ